MEAQKYKMTYSFVTTFGNYSQYVCFSPSNKVWVVYVHAAKAAEVLVNKEKKTLEVDIDQMTNFKEVKFTPNVSALWFTVQKA